MHFHAERGNEPVGWAERSDAHGRSAFRPTAAPPIGLKADLPRGGNCRPGSRIDDQGRGTSCGARRTDARRAIRHDSRDSGGTSCDIGGTSCGVPPYGLAERRGDSSPAGSSEVASGYATPLRNPRPEAAASRTRPPGIDRDQPRLRPRSKGSGAGGFGTIDSGPDLSSQPGKSICFTQRRKDAKFFNAISLSYGSPTG